MFVRVAALFACVLGVTTAAAEELAPEQARAFVAGKLFSYNCFDGTSGIGRIFPDGSIIGTVQPQGSTEVRFATLPPGTITVTSTSVCAHLPGLLIDPCFKVQKTDFHSFRGSISGLGFAYCDFRQRNPRATVTSRPGAVPPPPTTIANTRPTP